MKNNKFENYFVNSILLFLLTTTTYRLWPSFFPINKFSGFMVIGSLVLIILKRIRKKELLMYFFLAVAILLSSIFAQNYADHFNDVIYWGVTLLVFIKMADENFGSDIYNILKQKKKTIKNLIIFCNFIILIGLLIPNCYVYNWNETYYIGFGVASHSFCCGICLMLALTFVILGEKKCGFKNFLWFIPGMIGIFFSGARTYIVCIGIFLLVYYLYYLKKISWKLILLPIFFCLILYIMLKSNMIDKFVNSASNIYSSENSAVAFSNGRFDFWLIDLQKFGELNFINKLFGSGFDYVYHVNLTYYNLKIWAHNDIINCLLSVGFFGTTIYIIAILEDLQNLRKKAKKTIYILFFLYLWFVLLVNGLFAYQHFLYSALIFYIVLTCNPIFKKESKSL